MSRLIDADALERDGWQMSRTVRISKDVMELQTRKPTDFPAIEDAPTIEPQRWIPVTEALPKDGVTVWVTIRGYDVITCEEGETLEQAVARIRKIRWVTQGYWSEEEHGWNDPSFGCPLMRKPVAWMPMEVPDPWQGGQDD